jgi:hypothetical protein
MDISNTKAKNIYIEICYFTPINSTFYNKNNIDKNFPYNNIEQDIYNMRNEGSILNLRDFNVGMETNQAIHLSNDSNPNHLWLDKDLIFANIYKRNSRYLIDNLLGTKLIKIYSSQYLIICNGLMK